MGWYPYINWLFLCCLQKCYFFQPLYTNNTSVILPLKYRGEYRVIYIFICIRKPVLEFLTGCCYYLKVIPWFVLGLCWYCYLFVIPYHCFNPRLHYGLISIYKPIVPLLFTEVLLLPTFHLFVLIFALSTQVWKIYTFTVVRSGCLDVWFLSGFKISVLFKLSRNGQCKYF